MSLRSNLARVVMSYSTIKYTFLQFLRSSLVDLHKKIRLVLTKHSYSRSLVDLHSVATQGMCMYREVFKGQQWLHYRGWPANTGPNTC